MLLFLHFLVLWDCMVQHSFDSRGALNPGLGGLRDVASAIIFHEHTESNLVCCFQTPHAVFPKDLFSDYWHYYEIKCNFGILMTGYFTDRAGKKYNMHPIMSVNLMLIWLAWICVVSHKNETPNKDNLWTKINSHLAIGCLYRQARRYFERKIVMLITVLPILINSSALC